MAQIEPKVYTDFEEIPVMNGHEERWDLTKRSSPG